MVKKVVVISAVLCMLLCGCTSNQKIDELERRIEVLENAVGINQNIDDSTITDDSSSNADNKTSSIDYEEMREIDLFCDLDTEYYSSATHYEVVKNSDKCIFTYFYENGDIASTAFSLDVYNELVDLIEAGNIEEYEEKYDSNGQIVYEKIPYMVFIRVDKSGSYYLKTPSNIDEIVAKFESLKELAEK